MASTARPIETVEDILILSNGKSPVRINHRPSKIIPRFLPAKLFVSAKPSPFSNATNGFLMFQSAGPVQNERDGLRVAFLHEVVEGAQFFPVGTRCFNSSNQFSTTLICFGLAS